ncbi:MAG: hypothetical protein K8R53_08615, partial [Bacteroidales bacterium]|nr:hypothetical protein [Bacteroidales bacterium]
YSNHASFFYNKSKFEHKFNFLKNNPRESVMREVKEKLTLNFYGIKTVTDALNKLGKIPDDQVI